MPCLLLAVLVVDNSCLLFACGFNNNERVCFSCSLDNNESLVNYEVLPKDVLECRVGHVTFT